MEQTIKKRDLKLSDCNISKAKYNELRYFCMQYDEKKQELRNNYGLKAMASDSRPGGNYLSNPTERTAIRNVMLQNDLELIEETVMEADKTISKWLIQNVTEGIPYEWMDVPYGRRQFYEVRRYFFYLLSRKR